MTEFRKVGLDEEPFGVPFLTLSIPNFVAQEGNLSSVPELPSLHKGCRDKTFLVLLEIELVEISSWLAVL